MKESKTPTRLALLTFSAVLGSMIVVGLVLVPFLIRQMEQRYLLIQSDINARQARSIAQFAASRLQDGLSKSEVIQDLQHLLAGADADRGYSCVVDRSTTNYLCHPMTQAIGMSVAGKNAGYLKITSNLTSSERKPWEDAISSGLFGSGTLLYPDNRTEIVHMEKIAGSDWTVSTHENTARVQGELKHLRRLLIMGAALIGFVLAVPSSLAARGVSRRHEKQIEAEQERSERLLRNILPPTIAERLKSGEKVIADRHPEVTVLFADIVGFTPLAAQTSAEELVVWLNQIFSKFDDICADLGLEKIKTIGDAYMLCGGLADDPNEAACKVATAGLEMLSILEQFPPNADAPPLDVRIGIHTGELIAGVIGKRKFSYDLWGDVVNVASRLESSATPGKIQISAETASRIESGFDLESRGELSLKGKGAMEVWLITGQRGES